MDAALTTPWNPDESTVEHDASFRAVSGLTWLPWVGRKFSQRASDTRLLIVGESHYVRADSEEQLNIIRSQHLEASGYTREIVSECLLNADWPNKTLDNIPKVLFKSPTYDRARFWADTAFYNFVQRPMHYNQEGQPERPSWDDFVMGWRVFLDVIRIIQPSQCLFIGVEASRSFDFCMTAAGVPFTPITWPGKIGRTWARTARVDLEGGSIELLFVQHLGKYFSWIRWHDHLRSQHPEFMGWLAAEQYAQIAIPTE
jgi:hypothetical protein